MKSLHKSILHEAGLPTPRIIMKVGRYYSINTLEKFTNEIEKIDFPFLTKFDGGGKGVGVYLLQPDKDGFLCNGKLVDAKQIWGWYEKNIDRGFIVETKVDNHPSLAKLHPESLNTLRLNTIKTADGTWHLTPPILKIGRHRSHVDNMSAGGLMVGLSRNGVASPGHCRAQGKNYARHPETNCQIEGFQVPYFHEALELALEASRLFGFVGAIGWDVGITETGPTIVEGNLNWAITGQQEQLGPILTPEIAAGLIPRSWWTPWDKTHMYPYFQEHYAGGWLQRLMARRRQRWQKRLQER